MSQSTIFELCFDVFLSSCVDPVNTLNEVKVSCSRTVQHSVFGECQTSGSSIPSLMLCDPHFAVFIA